MSIIEPSIRVPGITAATNRVAVETGLGGAGGLALGMAFGGSITSIGKYTNQLDNVTKDYLTTLVKASRGDEVSIARLKSFFLKLPI